MQTNSRVGQLEHVRQSLLDASSAKEFVKMVLKLDQQMACTVSVLLWKMWDTRNKVNAADPLLSTQIICQITLEMAGLVQKQGTTHRPAAMPKLKWSRLPHDILKINSDGAYVKETGHGAWGFIIRDHAGDHVVAGAGNTGVVLDALMAEAVSCLKALEMVEMYSISRVQVEVDSSTLKEAITSDSLDRAPSGMIFRDIRRLLADHFVNPNVILIPRCINLSAHEIARLGLSWDLGQSHVWTGPLLDRVSVQVTHDLAESGDGNDRP